MPRCFKAVAAGVGVGGLAGTVAATWTDVPKVSVTGRTMSAAMGSTLAVVGRSSATFGSVALAFSAVECAAESMREKADVYNGTRSNWDWKKTMTRALITEEGNRSKAICCASITALLFHPYTNTH